MLSTSHSQRIMSERDMLTAIAILDPVFYMRSCTFKAFKNAYHQNPLCSNKSQMWVTVLSNSNHAFKSINESHDSKSIHRVVPSHNEYITEFTEAAGRMPNRKPLRIPASFYFRYLCLFNAHLNMTDGERCICFKLCIFEFIDMYSYPYTRIEIGYS